jgi:dTDP-4-dehydrorhamnose reductase
VDRKQLDLASSDSIRGVVRDVRPHVIVNAGAYTAVDQAEREEALALRVNCAGPAVLAEEAARLGALLVHFSTDYVFDGEKASPYVETDVPNPLNAYGRSKLAGERAIQQSGCRHLILRTSWVYAETGKNFVLTMLRLAREGKELRVVDDQFGAPTSSRMLAAGVPAAIAALSRDPELVGIYHMTAAGRTTWCAFARAFLNAKQIPAPITAISTAEYRTAAARPRNSILDNSKLGGHLTITLPHWESGMQDVVAQVP